MLLFHIESFCNLNLVSEFRMINFITSWRHRNTPFKWRWRNNYHSYKLDHSLEHRRNNGHWMHQTAAWKAVFSKIQNEILCLLVGLRNTFSMRRSPSLLFQSSGRIGNNCWNKLFYWKTWKEFARPAFFCYK